MKKGEKMPMEQRMKISAGVKRQHQEGRVRLVGFTDEARARGVATNWRGQKASKAAKHAWVRRKRGTPSRCEYCGTTEAKKFEWANVDHKYRRVLEDYVRLCTPCHRKYDYSIHGRH